MNSNFDVIFKLDYLSRSGLKPLHVCVKSDDNTPRHIGVAVDDDGTCNVYRILSLVRDESTSEIRGLLLERDLLDVYSGGNVGSQSRIMLYYDLISNKCRYSIPFEHKSVCERGVFALYGKSGSLGYFSLGVHD